MHWRARKALDRCQDRWVRRGPRTVLWTQPTAHLGNFLYDWMHAWDMRRRGADVVCLRTPAMDRWLPVFGAAAAELVVDARDVRLTDRREKGLHNEFGPHFDEQDLARFIEGFLEPSGMLDLERVPTALRAGEQDVVVNVRRGDYVSNEANWRNYGFDVDDYLRVALARSVEVGGPVGRIIVVSDGIEWCRQHLSWLAGHCESLQFEDAGQPPEVHLAVLAHASRLVLANSTFSYWGGYLSAWRSRRPEQVVAPWFHIRTDLGGAAWQLDPRWSIVRDIPTGWALPD
ncbi:alpha-1,2-fucosyltransferase [Nocardioides sp. S-58]|uniref:Alpha-1,2-fucosyltransferase n=1 Tax=Nocardioides renjunii TaxID=3095075 RepID=A0ABU5K735_9ACTN|nr:alpha-1,2-fucosyltransferase [Nocardioides sp. S-58]MDZ5660786.1 alpha-1,2-fucosyltransferase [Nocardioides sp. S-58]